MLEYTEQRIFACDLAPLAAAIPPAVYHGSLARLAELPPAPHFGPGPGNTGPTFLGRAVNGSWGLVPEVLVRLVPGPHGTMVELRVGAQLDQTTAVIAVLLLVFLWPVAVVCGLLAHQDFQQRRTAIVQGIWMQIASATGTMAPLRTPYGMPAVGAAPEEEASRARA